MNNSTLQIKNLSVKVKDSLILKNINLTIKPGEVHALIGPNGNGKSTLLYAIFGHHNYDIVEGDILLDGVSLLEKSVDEKSLLGLFLGMQTPLEIPGIVNSDFLKAILTNHHKHQKRNLSFQEFYKSVMGNLKQLNMNESLVSRYLNSGFSGGEKKKNEILQLLLLNPKLAFLDEIDSGLDVDALNAIGSSLLALKEKFATSFLIVSHYDNLFDLIKPNAIHIMLSGNLITCDDMQIIQKIKLKGFDFLYQYYKLEKPEQKKVDTVTPFALANK